MKFDLNKSLITLRRFYSIPKEEILTNYTWDEVQTMIKQIPIDQLVKPSNNPKKPKTEQQINKEWADHFFSVDEKKVEDGFNEANEILKRMKKE